MQMTPRASRTKRFTAAAIIALGMVLVLAGARPAQAELATGQSAFNKGDYSVARREFQGLAYGGDAVAQYYMGVIYGDGLEVEQSLEDALVWFNCAQAVGLPAVLGRDANRRQGRILARISSYELEQVELRAESVCGGAKAKKKRNLSDDKDALENIRPVRGLWAMLFFFPGDTMVTGAAIVFHELGLTFVKDLLVGLVTFFGDVLFGLLALIGCIIIGRIIHLFGDPVWKIILARDPLTHRNSAGGTAGRRDPESEAD